LYYVYAIKSQSRNYIYVGLSSDPEKRLTQHNRGYEKTTRPYRPFNIILKEDFNTRPEARKREKYLKSGAGKEFLKSL
jgi:putative endonuclease